MPSSLLPTLLPTETLGGVHADFASGIGRKVRLLTAALETLQWADAEKIATQIRSGAKVLKLQALCGETEDLSGELKSASQQGRSLSEPQSEAWRARVASWPGMAWTRTGSIAPASLRPTAAIVADVLVWGPEALADAVRAYGVYEAKALQSLDGMADETWTTARLVIVDTAAPDADAFFDLAQTHELPVVVLVQSASTSANWRARGASATMVAPVQPTALRRVVALWLREAPPAATDFAGVWTLGDIANRTADALCEALMPTHVQSRSLSVDLGDGHELAQTIANAAQRLRAALQTRAGALVQFAPIAPDSAKNNADTAWNRQGDVVDGTLGSVLRGIRVLVVEDDPATRWHFAGLLRSAGCEVLEASDGEQAWEQLQDAGVDLVVTDILMPNKDGFWLRDTLLADTCLHATPVILLSWKDDWLDIAMSRGASPRLMSLKDVAPDVFLNLCAASVAPLASLAGALGTSGLPLSARIEDLSAYGFGSLVCANYIESEMVLACGDLRVTLGFANNHLHYARAWAGDVFESGFPALRKAFSMKRGEVTLREGKDSLAEIDMHFDWQSVPARVRTAVPSETSESRMQQVSPQSRSPRSLWELSALSVQSDYVPRDGRPLPGPSLMLSPEVDHTPLDHITTHVDATLYGVPTTSYPPRLE